MRCWRLEKWKIENKMNKNKSESVTQDKNKIKYSIISWHFLKTTYLFYVTASKLSDTKRKTSVSNFLLNEGIKACPETVMTTMCT